jgi:hypothetical protein
MAAVALPDWLDFRPRVFPNCNFAWLRGPQPARPVARSFKTVGIESYYGPMCDSTVLFECPKREGVNGYLWRSATAAGDGRSDS